MALEGSSRLAIMPGSLRVLTRWKTEHGISFSIKSILSLMTDRFQWARKCATYNARGITNCDGAAGAAGSRWKKKGRRRRGRGRSAVGKPQNQIQAKPIVIPGQDLSNLLTTYMV